MHRPAVLLLTSLALVSAIAQVDAQFFTKTSKSIPRMGRRSASEQAASLTPPMTQQQRRLVVDSLIDELGPNLLEAIGESNDYRTAATTTTTNEQARASKSDVDQPLELNARIIPVSDTLGDIGFLQVNLSGSPSPLMVRDEWPTMTNDRQWRHRGVSEASRPLAMLRSSSLSRILDKLASAENARKQNKLQQFQYLD